MEEEEQKAEGLQIFVMPSFDSARESLGYNEYDDFNMDDVLRVMGYDGEYVDIEEDETFEIPVDYIGRISSGEDYYLLSNKKNMRDKKDYRIENDLTEGSYKLSVKDHVIYALGKRRRGI